MQQFPEVRGIVALGSTASDSERDRWSDHDFAIILRGASEKFLESSDWMPQSEKIIAHARHLAIYATAIYDDGHKVEYLICSECAAPEVSVTPL